MGTGGLLKEAPLCQWDRRYESCSTNELPFDIWSVVVMAFAGAIVAAPANAVFAAYFQRTPQDHKGKLKEIFPTPLQKYAVHGGIAAAEMPTIPDDLNTANQRLWRKIKCQDEHGVRRDLFKDRMVESLVTAWKRQHPGPAGGEVAVTRLRKRAFCGGRSLDAKLRAKFLAEIKYEFEIGDELEA